MIAAGFARLLSAPLHRAEALDPAATGLRAQLAPTSLSVIAEDLGWAATLYIGRSGSEIYPGADSSADAILRGSSAALLALAAEPDRPLAGSGVKLQGSAPQLAAIVNYLRQLRPDWAGQFSRLAGPVPTAGATALASGLASWVRRANVPAAAADHLIYDAQLLVSTEDGRGLARQLAEARARADRLAARLDALQQPAPSAQESFD